MNRGVRGLGKNKGGRHVVRPERMTGGLIAGLNEPVGRYLRGSGIQFCSPKEDSNTRYLCGIIKWNRSLEPSLHNSNVCAG